MLRLSRSLAPLFALTLLAASCTEQETAANDPDRDSATLRRAATDEWYNEAHTQTTSAEGGPWSAEFRAAMLDTAKQERERWGALLPGGIKQTLIAGTQWANLGPTKATFETNSSVTLNVSDSGRPRSIVPDGTTRLYVASAGGGVWKRESGTWTALTDSLGTLSCGSLVIDPNNNKNLFLGLGDPFDGTGIGFVKSTDGGTSWSTPVLLGGSRVIPQVVVSPSSSSILLVATDKGLYRSTDAGTSFSAVTIATGQTELPYIWSIAVTGAHSFVLTLEATHSATTGTTNGQSWYSLDDGVSWTQSTGFTKTAGIGRATVASAPSSQQTVYAMAAIPNSTAKADLADIFKSTDGGKTWTALNASATNKRYTNTNTESSNVNTILNGQGWYNQLVLVDPTNPSTVYFGGSLLLAKSTDGGSTYTQLTNWLAQFGLPYVHADFHAGAFDASGNLYVGTDGGIFESTNGGTTWTDTLNVGLITHLLYSVGSSLASANAVIGGFQDNGTRIRESSTTVFDQVIGGDGFGSNINRSNAQLMLGSIYYDQIMKSTNGGTTWSTAYTGITGAGPNGSTTAPFFTKIFEWEGATSTGNELYTFNNSTVYKSTNYAGSWAAQGTAVTTTGIIRNIGVAAANANVIGVVGSGGRVWLSKDGGTTWTLVASGDSFAMPPAATALPGSNLSMSYIHFDVSNTNIVYVASVAPNAKANHLWKSIDFGANWVSIDGNGLPAGAPVNQIKSDPKPDPTAPSQVLYAGTHLGVYKSTDGGATWARFGAGMPLVSVQDLYIAPDESIVRAASYGRGFWQLNSPPPANDFSISANPTTVTVMQGQSGTTSISTTVTTGAAQPVALTASGLPTGATAMFNPASVTAGASSTLTLTAGAATPPGTYSVLVTGTGTSATHSTTVSFVVTALPNNFTIAANPTTVTAMQGTSGTTSITTAVASGVAESIALTASGVPTGATATFNPTSVTAGNASTLTLAAGTATPGTYMITVTGTAASATHTTTVSFTVTQAAANDFGITATPSMVTVAEGAMGTTSIDTTVTSGAAQTVALTASGLPAGATASFNPASITAGGSSTLTLTAGATTPAGMYSVTVTGTGTSTTHTTTVTLVVTAVAADDFSLSANASGVSLAQGASGTVGIDTMVTAGSAQSVALSATGLPAGAAASFSPASVTAGASSTLMLTAGTSTPAGMYTITVTGTGTSATHSTTVTMTVMAAAADDFAVTASPASITVAQGGSATSSINTSLVSGSPQDVTVTVDGVPSGVTATFDNASFTVGGSATLTVVATSGAAPGTYALNVTATGTSATHMTTVTLTVETGTGGGGTGGSGGGGKGGCGCTVGGQPQPGANVAGGFVLVLFGVGLVGWRRRRA